MRTILTAAVALAGCGTTVIQSGDGGAVGRDLGVADGGGGDLAAACAGLRCQLVQCKGGASTVLTGTVHIPAGNLPLHGVTVYVPNAAVGPVQHGASCDRCDAPLSGDPIVRTTTDVMGRFSLAGVPAGTDIPLVIQAGRWRRRAVVARVEPCVATAVPEAATRLPRNQQEGDVPRIALTTGGADAVECLLRKLGIADQEFTPESGPGRVHLYAGREGTNRYRMDLHGGAVFTAAPTFWEQLANLRKYDVVVHSCEGTDQHPEKSQQARTAFRDYIDGGGRVFLSHEHATWVREGPAPLPTVAKFNRRPDLPSPIDAEIDLSFEEGRRFADWMVHVGASAQRGQVKLHAAQNSVESVNGSVAQRWIHIPSQNNVQYLSFNAPVGAAPDKQCGRVVMTDIHVSSGDDSSPALPFPDGCKAGELSAQEKALLYILFDLANCLDVTIG